MQQRFNMACLYNEAHTLFKIFNTSFGLLFVYLFFTFKLEDETNEKCAPCQAEVKAQHTDMLN